jgi:hypothetical protein
MSVVDISWFLQTGKLAISPALQVDIVQGAK